MGCDWLIGGLGGAFSPSEAHVSIMDAARVPSVLITIVSAGEDKFFAISQSTHQL